MSYKTILVYLDRTVCCNERIKIAANIALTNEAHLVGASMIGISTARFEDENMALDEPEVANHIKFLRERAAGMVANFEATAKKIGVPLLEGRVVDGDANAGIALQARYCDLTIIGQANPKEPSREVGTDFPEYVVLNAGRPVLIVPHVGEFASVGKKVLIAWDGSREATRAVNDAIPLLKRADFVQIALFNANGKPFGDQPGDDIALHLARHGLTVEVLKNRKATDVGRAVLSLAAELSSDLLVMGCYGHSRLRERLLGGTTRTILENMTLPVLMSH